MCTLLSVALCQRVRDNTIISCRALTDSDNLLLILHMVGLHVLHVVNMMWYSVLLLSLNKNSKHTRNMKHISLSAPQQRLSDAAHSVYCAALRLSSECLSLFYVASCGAGQ